MKRHPAVAGYFYPGRAQELREMIEGFLPASRQSEKALAVVSPHAGYIYSGKVAAAVYASVKIPEAVVILGPSHRGIRPLFAVQANGIWQTPLGEVKVDSQLARELQAACALVEDDPRAHLLEHSLEVQVPFLQYFQPKIAIVPVCVSHEADLASLEELGKALAAVVSQAKKEVLLVASTDMSHYVSQEEAERKDFLAIKKVQELDFRGLYEVVLEENISMCGFQPTTAVLVASRELGATKAELILYQTSGDVTGDRLEVVGYAGCRIS